jgi:hypothetical protein
VRSFGLAQEALQLTNLFVAVQERGGNTPRKKLKQLQDRSHGLWRALEGENEVDTQ